jgi:hypothetical protein
MNNLQIENINEFSASAAMYWIQFPDHTRDQILSTVWCGRCCEEVRITAYSGALRSGDLLLVGKCSICRNDVAKTIDLQHSDSKLLG